MRVETEQQRGITVMRLVGKLSIGVGDVELRRRFVELLQAGRRRFLFDMTLVPYVDSAGVGEIVACAKRAADGGAVIRIVMSATGKSREVFVVACLDRVFEIFTDEDAALASFSP